MDAGCPNGRSLPGLLRAILFALCALAGSAAAPAMAAGNGSACIGYGSAVDRLADSVRMARWDCSSPAPDLGPDRMLLRFEPVDSAQAPDGFTLRRSAIGAVHVIPLDAAGRPGQTRSYSLDDFRPAGIAGMVRLPLPPGAIAPGGTVVALDRPTTPLQASMARLAKADEPVQAAERMEYVLAALVAGMVFIPLILNFAFWRVLRQRFLLAHAALALSMLLTVTASSNLLVILFDAPMSLTSELATIGFGLAVASGAMFAREFIEPGKLSPRLRAALIAAAGAAAALSLAHALWPDWQRAIQLKLYMLAFLPILLLLIAVIAQAIMRGSRAGVYQLIGWVPLLSVGLVRQVTFLAPAGMEQDAMGLFYFGCAFEVIATTLGVIDRFMIIRHERDVAVAETAALERLAERDPLTGLMNRRAVEPQFAQLCASGFTVCALIDLDRFKTVNDTHGHSVGDSVLCAVARALQPDSDTLAMRLGGEEFMLLLRGPDALRRAEARRQAIGRRVAIDIPGLGGPVTASMGLVEMPAEIAGKLTFRALYARADTLLYEAKEAGRNRTISEKMTVFARRSGDRRVANRCAA